MLRPQLSTSAVNKGLQRVNDLIILSFEVDHIVDKFLNIKHKVEAVMAVQRTCRRRQSNQRSPLSSLHFLSPLSVNSTLFYNPENIQPRTPSPFQSRTTQMFSCLTANLHIIFNFSHKVLSSQNVVSLFVRLFTNITPVNSEGFLYIYCVKITSYFFSHLSTKLALIR